MHAGHWEEYPKALRGSSLGTKLDMPVSTELRGSRSKIFTRNFKGKTYEEGSQGFKATFDTGDLKLCHLSQNGCGFAYMYAEHLVNSCMVEYLPTGCGNYQVSKDSVRTNL